MALAPAVRGHRGSLPDLEAHPPPSRPAGFGRALRERAGVLVGLLAFQSCSSFILASYSELLTRHATNIYFLTMLVGAGGNAGNQASVLVIRGLATNDIGGHKSQLSYLAGEAYMACGISGIMVAAGFVRVIAFGAKMDYAVAIAASLLTIVFISIVVGAVLPLGLQRLGLDPAHAGATIQVIMDLSGVLITCVVCSTLLPDSDSSAISA